MYLTPSPIQSLQHLHLIINTEPAAAINVICTYCKCMLMFTVHARLSVAVGRAVTSASSCDGDGVESQSGTDGVKAGLLQCHRPPAISAHRQGAKDQKGEPDTAQDGDTLFIFTLKVFTMNPQKVCKDADLIFTIKEKICN